MPEYFMLCWLTPEGDEAGDTGPWTWEEVLKRLTRGPGNGFVVRPADDATIREYLDRR